jgi:hypothetical protein
MTAVTLQGADWLLYNVYDVDTVSHIHWTSTALDFKVFLFQLIYLDSSHIRLLVNFYSPL